MRVVRSVLILVSIFYSVSSFAQLSLTKEEVLKDVQTFLTQLDTHYGMPEYKLETFGINPKAIYERIETAVTAGVSLEGRSIIDAQGNISLEEAQQYMVYVAAAWRDGHTNIKRNTNDGWTLGIKTAEIDGRLTVVGFSEDFYQDKDVTEPLRIGDIVLEVNGRPVEEIAKENMLYAQTATFKARNMWALENILNVPSSYLRSKRDGEQVRVTFGRPRPDGALKTITGFFNWINVKNFYKYPIKKSKGTFHYGSMGGALSYFRVGLENIGLPEGSIVDLNALVNLKISKEMKLNALKKASAKAELPDKKMQEVLSKHVVAKDGADLALVDRIQIYTVAIKGRLIGVVRIPDFNPPGGSKEMLAELAFLKRAIPYLSQNTKAVIVDITSNGGGRVSYVTELLRFFASGHEIPTMTNDIRLSQTILNVMSARAENAKKTEDEIDQVMADNPEFASFAEVVMSEIMIARLEAKFKSGQRYSGPMPFMGTVDSINDGQPGVVVASDQVTYPHKVIVLTDPRDASGAEFFSLMMKNFALVMGTPGKGLVGPVYDSIRSLGKTQMSLRSAFGISRTADGVAYENVGSVPHVHREVTRDDLMQKFSSYSKDILTGALLYSIGKSPEEISMALHRAELNPALVSEAAKAVDDKVDQVLQAAENGDIKQVTAAYAELKASIDANSSKIEPYEWARLQIPVVKTLYHKDLILRSIRDRSAVLERLGELAILPHFKSDPDLLALIQLVKETIASTRESSPVLTPCNLRLINVLKNRPKT